MDKRTHYITVGSFVLASIAAMFIFTLWLVAGGESRSYNRYRVYFTGAVNGLNVGSAVRYLGVQVGTVEAIGLDSNTPDRVKVRITVDERTPIRQNTQASLKLQGITGIAFVELKGTTLDSPPLLAKEGENLPVMYAQSTGLEKALDNAPRMVESLLQLSERANQLLSDENLASFSATLTHVQEISGAMAGQKQDISDLIKELSNVASSLESAFSRGGTQNIELLMRDTRSAIQELKGLAQTLKENPSQVIHRPSYQGVPLKP